MTLLPPPPPLSPLIGKGFFYHDFYILVAIPGVASVGDVVVHLGCSSEVGLSFELGRCTIKSCTILVNNRQTGISVKVYKLLSDSNYSCIPMNGFLIICCDLIS